MVVVDIGGRVEDVREMLSVDELALATPAGAGVEVEPTSVVEAVLSLLAKLPPTPPSMAAARRTRINNVDARKKVRRRRPHMVLSLGYVGMFVPESCTL